MTTEQWTLLSNIVHAYDQQDIFFNMKQALKHESSLPIKLRAKASGAANYLFRSIQSAQKLLQECPHFHTLQLGTRRALVKNNLIFTGSVNAMIIGHEVDLWNNGDYGMSLDALFGPGSFEKYLSVPKRMDTNGILFKMILFTIGFSSNYSIITTNQSMETSRSLDSVSMVQMQDIYVTLLWKYLVYQYGFTEAVLRYASVIKTLLDVLTAMEEFIDTEVYQQSMGKAVFDMERLLIIDNWGHTVWSILCIAVV